MSNLHPFKKLLCLLLFAIAICIIPVKASSMSFREYEGIKDAFTNALGELRDTITDFGDLKGERDDCKVLYDENAEEIRDQGIQAAHQGVSLPFIVALGPLAPTAAITELRQAITNAHLTANDLADGIHLAKALDIAIDKTDKLRSTIGDPVNGSQQATGLFKKRDDAYKAYVAAYKEYHGTPSATPTLDKGRNTAPIDNTSFSYGCFGSNTCEETFSSPSAAMTTHFTQCQEKPHKGQKFGWYSCERSSCPSPDVHWRLCPGICGRKFAPKKVHLQGAHYTYLNNSPHKRVCKERVYDGFWNFVTNLCHIQYNPAWYTCEYKKCPNSSYHREIDNNDPQPETPTPTPTPTPSPTPTYHACGVHETTVSGDHSWVYRDCPSGHAHYACDGSDHSVQATCTETNANGDSCTVTGFYACQTHTHQFPDPNLCPAAGCNVRITTTNASEHALVTCTGSSHKSCQQAYYKCQADDHKWLSCTQVSCGYKVRYGQVFMIRRCKIADTPRSCVWIGGHRQLHTPYLQ